jgi:hypothetical protein
MPQKENLPRIRKEMHPLFVELFLSEDTDDEERGGRRARQRAKVTQKRIIRGK